MKRRLGAAFWTGFAVFCLGALLLINELGWIRLAWATIWPLFILGIGLCFHIGFALGGARAPGILVPGGILVTYGLLLFACTVLGWGIMARWWPIFIIGPGVGLFELYLFSRKPRDRGLLIPVFILFGIGLAMLIVESLWLSWNYFLPVLLIVAGVVVVALGLTSRRARPEPREREDYEDGDFMSTPSRPRVQPPKSPLEEDMPVQEPAWPSPDEEPDGPDALEEMNALDNIDDEPVDEFLNRQDEE